jgi:hypothetical protein
MLNYERPLRILDNGLDPTCEKMRVKILLLTQKNESLHKELGIYWRLYLSVVLEHNQYEKELFQEMFCFFLDKSALRDQWPTQFMLAMRLGYFWTDF